MKVHWVVIAVCCLSASVVIGCNIHDSKRTPKMTNKNPIQSIQFRNVGKDWLNETVYFADGRIERSHMAGNPAFVHEEKSTMDKRTKQALWREAEKVCQKHYSAYSIPDPAWTGHKQIEIIRQNGAVSILWPTEPEKGNPGSEVKALLELILK